MLGDLLHRLRVRFLRKEMDAEVREELCNHLERETEKYRRAGRWGLGLTAEKMKECIWIKLRILAEIPLLEWTGQIRWGFLDDRGRVSHDMKILKPSNRLASFLLWPSVSFGPLESV